VERDKSLIGLITTIVDSVIYLVRGHIELAKAELIEAFKNVIKSSVLFLIAIVLINLSVVFLLISLAIWLSEVMNMSNSSGFLIVGGSLFVLAITLILIGLVKLSKVKNSRKTIDSLNATVESLRALIPGNK
jgi:uncharacterized membrane protein YqjE